jgi:hypothetical protein
MSFVQSSPFAVRSRQPHAKSFSSSISNVGLYGFSESFWHSFFPDKLRWRFASHLVFEHWQNSLCPDKYVEACLDCPTLRRWCLSIRSLLQSTRGSSSPLGPGYETPPPIESNRGLRLRDAPWSDAVGGLFIPRSLVIYQAHRYMRPSQDETLTGSIKDAGPGSHTFKPSKCKRT